MSAGATFTADGNDEVEENGYTYGVSLFAKHGKVLPKKIGMMLS